MADVASTSTSDYICEWHYPHARAGAPYVPVWRWAPIASARTTARVLLVLSAPGPASGKARAERLRPLFFVEVRPQGCLDAPLLGRAWRRPCGSNHRRCLYRRHVPSASRAVHAAQHRLMRPRRCSCVRACGHDARELSHAPPWMPTKTRPPANATHRNHVYACANEQHVDEPLLHKIAAISEDAGALSFNSRVNPFTSCGQLIGLWCRPASEHATPASSAT